MKKIITTIIMISSFLLLQKHSFAADSLDLSIASQAAILMDSQTGAVLYEKNANTKMYPASLTKIATAIYAIEHGNLNDRIIVSKKATEVEGTKVYLNEGEEVSLEHLIQGMLINSGNDAAEAIAEHLNGNVDQFSAELNRYLKNVVKVKNTHFTNPHGLFNEDHYTTAYDMALITNYALQNDTFSKIFGTKELLWDGQTWDTTLYTHHRMLKGEVVYKGVTGGKTGYVDESKQTLATTAENDQIKLTSILLKADTKQSIYTDTIQLLDYGFQNFKTTMIPKNKIYEFNNKEFITKKEEWVTIPLQNAIEEVTTAGLMEIKNQDGELIQSIELDEKENKPAAQIVQHKNDLPLDKKSIGLHYYIPLFFILAAVIFARNKRLSVKRSSQEGKYTS
ncbi:D-alanyl-D-alanine carboxypeptidase family protein [Bacillus sp. 03113]|uniref:D-alanyl-D-alanine carboxypeptidase family protein n=1 Tax=Bacillus sp. 03113 TaxID=2578211 RepID=UPI0011437077|nr:D-alanyl-D-alanine carboxypeptidase family protein [Bacillus sp. 03113]